MNSIIQERLISVALSRKAAIDRRELLARPAIRVPTRRQARQARKSFIQLVRTSQPDSMLNMPRPAHHRPVPLVNDERTRTELARHVKRREAGWIRG